MNGIIEATPENNTLVISGLDGGSDFTNVSWDDNGSTITGLVVTDGVKPIKQLDQISNLNGLEQSRSEILSFLPAQMDENASAFEVVVNDQIIPLELPASVDPLDAVRFEILLNSFQSINQDGTISEDGLPSANPAFSVTFDEVNFSYIIEGTQNTETSLSEQMQTRH